MPKEAARRFSQPLPGGLSILSMDFTSKGLTFAGNIYQKWENICLDNILAQKPCKYVDLFGEQFRKILAEVADGCVPDLSGEHDTVSGLHNKVSDKALAESVELETFASSSGDCSCRISANRFQGLNRNDQELIRNSAEIVGSFCPDNSGGNSDDGSDGVVSHDVTHTDEFFKESAEATAIHDVDTNKEPLEGFEKVTLKDCWENIEISELISITKQAWNNLSYKRKFRLAFSPKTRSSTKVQNQTEDCCIRINMSEEDELKPATSSISGRTPYPEMSVRESSEYGWVLL